MKYEGDDVREFTRSMERALRTLGAPHPRDREAFLRYQENQVNRLVALEEEFRRAVLLLPAWEDVYRSFVTHVRTPGDSVSARPFFRERKGTFTATIGPALLAADAATLALYRINHRFLMWFNQTRPEMMQSPFPRITTEVIQLRKEMALLLTPLTLSYIRVFWNRTPRSHLSLLDLLGHAIEGVMASVDKYTPPFSAVYRSVALGRITGNLIECYSLTCDTIIQPCEGQAKAIKEFKAGDEVWGVDDQGTPIKTRVVALHDHGELPGFEVEFDDGYRVTSSINHKFLTTEGMVPLHGILARQLGVYCDLGGQVGGVGGPLRVDDINSIRHEGAPPIVRGVFGGRLDKTAEGVPRHARSEHEDGWMDECVWAEICQEATDVRSSEGLRRVPSVDQRGVECARLPMAGAEPREVAGQSARRLGGPHQVAGGESRGGTCVDGTLGGWPASMACGSPRAECGDRAGNARVAEAEGLAAGGVSAKHDLALESQPDPLWREGEGGGLHLGEQRDLGRGGRFLALHDSSGYSSSAGTVGISTIPRSTPEPGSGAARRRDVDPSLGGLFFPEGDGGLPSSGVDGVAYGQAPLADPGDLVLRRIVRVRAVGLRRMYDLEVAHPKHNFILPNGVVTSNSETSVKFSSNDRRILYRANKLVGKSTPGLGGTDYADLAARVNLSARRRAPKDRKIEGSEDLLPEYLPEDEAPFSTTAQHLSWLMGAASPVSADTPAGQDQEGAPRGTRLARIAAPAYLQPDNMVETGESLAALYAAVGTLDLVEQKYLALRGVGGDHGSSGIGIVADQGRGEDAPELRWDGARGQASAG